MSKTAITKEALSMALKSLAKTKPLSKITIKDITDYCDISRNTFYYHFTDKFDLVNWIVSSETLREINTFCEPELWLEGFVNLCKHLHQNRRFYREAISYIGETLFQEHLLQFYFELLKLHLDTLYSDKGYKLDDEELSLLARMQAYSYVGIIMDWIHSGMKNNYTDYYEKLKRINALGNVGYSLIEEYSDMSQNI